MLDDSFHVFDTTLRDGAQREGMSYSVADKLAVARLLDELGVGFIEGGWPGALPKDTEFFARARTELELRHAQLVAFGATRKAGARAATDPQVLRAAGRADPGGLPGRQVRPAARAPGAADHAGGEPGHGRRHGRLPRRRGPPGVPRLRALLRRLRATTATTALRVLEAAFAAGADVGVLCDTNGGMLPMGVGRTVAEVIERTGFRVGMHARTTPPARSPTPSPRSRPGSRTCRAPPTATASGPATPTCSP